MFIRNAFLAAAAVASLATAPAMAATTYNATSHIENGSPEHSLWFENRPRGSGLGGDAGRHFLFEPSVGTFKIDGATASLTGTVKNAIGEGFEILMSFVEVAKPMNQKRVAGVSDADFANWKYYDLTSGLLKSLTGNINDFSVDLRGKGLMAQFGVGANDKNADLLGFSTWFTATETVCNIQKTDRCVRKGDINILLEKKGGGTGVVPLPASIALLPLGLGMLGFAGRVSGRRRKS